VQNNRLKSQCFAIAWDKYFSLRYVRVERSSRRIIKSIYDKKSILALTTWDVVLWRWFYASKKVLS